ncbi:MAG: hypothetical protein JHD15_07555 [Phenylobacterium sp.]|jgi:hypothetical protein|uniref:hypothetical protein n=1 Tax=Phenylobacterium sp. TaxID=1871053 RepID=UPI001A32902F|nr:hypothetical protein [Phenylobacterium sp.]MBJ7410207.1 hypothetical protein [Phenylobacterium sp.]
MKRSARETTVALGVSLVTVLATAAVLLAASRTPDPYVAAGVFPPWWTRTAVIAAAGQAGSIRDLGAAPFIVVVRDPEGRVQARLRAAGALFSVGPAGSAACGPQET